ncbi:MAG: alpha/beta hydrolase [Planctomycetes bacterium]|nr:alpha/beta hydrolase [Planctomycetota bacterium]
MQNGRSFLVLVCLVVLAGCTSAPRSLTHPAGVEIVQDQTYRVVDGIALGLDLYRPDGVDEALPVIVWVHGGGWFRGKKDDCPIAGFARHGYVVAAIDYRVTRQAVFPAPVTDCKAAVSWLRANASRLRIDPDRIGVWGSSAGGHLAALVGTTNGHEFYEDPETRTRATSDVRCVCAFFPPTDLLRLYADSDPRFWRIRMAIPWLLGASVDRRTAAARAASPLALVTPSAVPFLIFHGDADTMVPLKQSELFDGALRAAGVESRLIVVPGAGHSDFICLRSDVEAEAVAFFDRHLKPERLGSEADVAGVAEGR